MNLTTPKSSRIPRISHWVLGLSLLGVVAITYLRVLSAGFIWDDDSMVTANPLILGSHALYKIWCTTEGSDYWPITSTSLWIQYKLWGLNPLGFHLFNISLHALECVLLWKILTCLEIPGAFLAACLFAVHPVNAESVAWIAEIKNLTGMLFFLGSIYFFTYSLGTEKNKRYYVLSLLCFLCGMLSKGSVAMLPFVLLGISLYKTKFSKDTLIRLIPFSLISAGLISIDIWFQHHGSTVAIRHASSLERILGASFAGWFYLSKAIIPLNLSFVYPPLYTYDPRSIFMWVPTLLTVLTTALLIQYRNKEVTGIPLIKWILIAWLYFWVNLVPALGLTDVYFMKFSLVADHYQHLALIAVTTLFASLWYTTNKKTQSFVIFSVAPVLIITLSFLTYNQTHIYKDSKTLYTAILKKYPGCWLAKNNLAMVFADEGNHKDAITLLRSATELNPEYAEAENNLGYELALTGNQSEAEVHFRNALRINPKYAQAEDNLGLLLRDIGQKAEAEQHFITALTLKPEFAEAHNNYALLLEEKEDFKNAELHFREAIRIKPDFTGAVINLSNLLSRQGSLRLAESLLKDLIQKEPTSAEAFNSLGIILAQKENFSEARIAFEKSLKLNPQFILARINLGFAYIELKQFDSAITEFKAVLAEDPKNKQAREYLIELLKSQNRTSEALLLETQSN